MTRDEYYDEYTYGEYIEVRVKILKSSMEIYKSHEEIVISFASFCGNKYNKWNYISYKNFSDLMVDLL